MAKKTKKKEVVTDVPPLEKIDEIPDAPKPPPPVYVDSDGSTYRCPEENCGLLLVLKDDSTWCPRCKLGVSLEAAVRQPKPELPADSKRMLEEAAKVHGETIDTAPLPPPKAPAPLRIDSIEPPEPQPYPEQAPPVHAQARDPQKAAEVAAANVPGRPADRQPKHQKHAFFRIPGGFTGRAVQLYRSLAEVLSDQSLEQFGGAEKILRGPHGGPPSTPDQCFYLCRSNAHQYPMICGELDAHLMQQGTEDWD